MSGKPMITSVITTAEGSCKITCRPLSRLYSSKAIFWAEATPKGGGH
jgi:hypothetical protein